MTKKKLATKTNKIYVGFDPSFKGFGVSVIIPHLNECHIREFSAPYVEKHIIGYAKAALNVTQQIDEFLYNIKVAIHKDCYPRTMVIAEHPPAGGGGNAMATQPLYGLGTISYALLGTDTYTDGRYFTVPPSKAGWMAECPRKISRSDKKRITKEYAIALLASSGFTVVHRGKIIPDIMNLRTKPKRKGDPGKPKKFSMTDNEAEAFLYACLAVRTEHLDLITITNPNKHWDFQEPES